MPGSPICLLAPIQSGFKWGLILTCITQWTVGQRYADRDRWLATLIEAGIPIDIYGAGWHIDDGEHDSCLPKGVVYLGRRQILPGTLRSYLQLVTKELKRDDRRRALRNLVVQAAYRRETRRVAQKLRPHAKGKASDLSSVFGAYEICLNFSNVWANGRPGSPLKSHVRLRDFEAPMCRTCYLTGHNDEITDFYAIGGEVDTYRDKLELVDKMRFYFANPYAAERLREAGYRRALRDHTWRRRFEELFQNIGLTASRA
jgi:spore maturation protein CgeB